jgi:hypothetical protein
MDSRSMGGGGKAEYVSKRKLGAEHPNTLNSMNNLTFTVKAQGRDA